MGTPREMPMMKVALVAALLAFVSAQNASNATVGANETGTFSEQTPTKGQQPGMNNDAEKAHSNPTNRSTMTLKSLSPAKKCPNNCNDHGLCVDGQCLCEPGYIEADCRQTASCHMDCSNHGFCKYGKCFCDPGFYGEGCDVKVKCPKDCSGKGNCQWGKCFCEPGYGGTDCAKKTGCPNKCSNNGICVQGQCACAPGFSGLDCGTVDKMEEACQ